MDALTVPEPGALVAAGLKVTVTPAGAPEAEKAIAELNPPEIVAFTVEAPLPPCTTEAELAVSANAGMGAAVTVSVKLTELVMPCPLPVTVIGYEPVATVDATATVAVDVPEPGAAVDVGLKVTVTPEGCPDADNAMAELNPPEILAVTVEFPLPP